MTARATTRRSGAMDATGFRLDIQGLRGFALVLVLATHAEVPHASGGFVGLDVFYVLSGFLITGLILHEVQRSGRVSVLSFYARRARRLLPLAVTVLGAIFVCSLMLFGPVRGYAVSRDMLAATLYVANWHFMAQETDYFAFDSADQSPIQHYWSLSVEEQFYLLWPLVIGCAIWFARRTGRSPRSAIGLVLAPMALASLAYGAWFSGVDPQKAYFSTLARGWELGLGCALALVLPKGIRLSRLASGALTAAGLGALVWTTVILSGATPYPGWWALVPTLASVAIIVAGTAERASAPVRLLSAAPLQYLGRISYAWYLWHWPALVFASAGLGVLSTGEKVAVTLLAWVPTIVTHHLIEERFRRSRRLARRPAVAIAVGVACSGLAIGMATSLAGLQVTVPTAQADQSPGARALDHGQTLQRSARSLRPSPRHVEDDRGRAFKERCHLKGTRRVRSPECVYGDRSARRTVVNIGDSHGLMYAPAGMRLAGRHHWRFVTLTRAGCTTASVSYEDDCDQWRENSLRRIERERPRLVIISNGTDDGDRYALRGRGRDESEALLERGFRRTLRRLRRTGAKVVVIRDIARAPEHVVECVARHAEDLARCAFAPRRSPVRAFDARAARGLKGVTVIDPLKALCPRQAGGARLCPAVIGNVIVYRNDYHLSATFARTLSRWLGHHLPRLR